MALEIPTKVLGVRIELFIKAKLIKAGSRAVVPRSSGVGGIEEMSGDANMQPVDETRPGALTYSAVRTHNPTTL